MVLQLVHLVHTVVGPLWALFWAFHWPFSVWLYLLQFDSKIIQLSSYIVPNVIGEVGRLI